MFYYVFNRVFHIFFELLPNTFFGQGLIVSINKQEIKSAEKGAFSENIDFTG